MTDRHFKPTLIFFAGGEGERHGETRARVSALRITEGRFRETVS